MNQPHNLLLSFRWEVFKRDNAKKRHQAVGSVHAGAAEHALHSARNVFVRRPSAISLWVVPVTAIFALNSEEMAADPDWHTRLTDVLDTAEPFMIFRKTGYRRSMTFVEELGLISATSTQEALHKALTEWDDTADSVWWVVRDADIVRSEEADVMPTSWFDPAKDKTYRNQSNYGFVRAKSSRN